ncbi:MAG TPA: cyclic nucleotide-binding domain-containing protein [Nannocystis sp.]
MRDDDEPRESGAGERLRLDHRTEALIRAALPGMAGRLSFGDELARGGMGAVRVAFDAALQRRMAAKVMHEASYERLMLVHGFLREAQVTGQLDHPNIVPIYELGRDERGGLYFTMKLIEGQSLRALIGRRPPANYEALYNRLQIFIKVCDALAFAHSRGVIHCDIKSANVMVGEYGEVLLMDWGGARLLEPPPGRDTSGWVHDSLPPLSKYDTDGLVLGSPSYMSPEQAGGVGVPLDERSDVFSMGALLYEMMTGRPPYASSSAWESLALARAAEIVPPDQLPGMPVHVYLGELLRIVMKALERRPEDRYASVDGFKQDLFRLFRGASNFETVQFAPGTYVIREGEHGDAAYMVVSGKLEVSKQVDGTRRVLRELGPGEVFGETAIFAASRRTASVRVVEQASLIAVNSQVMEQELLSMKPWMSAFIRTLASRFGGLDGAASIVAPPSQPEQPGEMTVVADVMSDLEDEVESEAIEEIDPELDDDRTGPIEKTARDPPAPQVEDEDDALTHALELTSQVANKPA